MTSGNSGRTGVGTERRTDRVGGLPDRGGIDVFDSLLVRQPIQDGQTDAVRETLATWAAGHADADARTVLPVEGVTLVTLFLDTGAFGWPSNRNDRGDALLWYVEVVDDDAPMWTDPDGTLRAESPLFDAGLDELCLDAATMHVDGRDGHQLITHATHPTRQARYADHVGQSLVAPVGGEDLQIPVVVTSLPLQAGLVSRLVSGAVRAGNWLKRFDRVAAWLRNQTDTLEAEAMYTESLLLESVGDRLVLHYYMETEDMDRLYDAYDASTSWEVRFSDWMMRRIFVDSADVLEPPLESDCEVLLHAVDPDRP